MNSALANWKTSLAGIAAGLAFVGQAYHPGMTWQQWLSSVIPGLATALIGLLSHDGFAPPKP
jgi:hypothetical protein